MEIVIEPGSRSRLLGELVEVWRFRGLLGLLMQRDLKVRYRETALGIAWAILQPVALMGVFWLALGRVLKFPVGNTPYPLFVLAGLIPWNFFASAISASSGSLLAASGLMRKVYFPRMVIPLSVLGAALVDFAIGLVLLATVAAWHGVLSARALVAIVPLALLVLATVAVAILAAALAALYRDARYIIPLAIQVWFFATPVIYPAAVVAPEMRWILQLNPLVPLIDGVRLAMIGGVPDWAACFRSGALFALMAWLAGRIFLGVQRRLADEL